jgi:hypothetical protein
VFFSVHTLVGDPEELLRGKRDHMDPVVARLAPRHGAIASVTVAGENGITTYNLWRDAEGAAAFSREPEVQQTQRRSGLPAPSSFVRYDNVEAILY